MQPKTFQELKNYAKTLIIDALYHIITFLYIAIVYGAAIYIENQLISFVWWLIEGDTQRFPFLAQFVDYARIGLGIIFVFAAVVHSCFSALSQIGLDWKFFKMGNKK